MNKFRLLIVVIVALLIVIAGIIIFTNQEDIQKPVTSISSDSFSGLVISKDNSKIIVIPNEDELMREMSFDIVDVMVDKNTQLLNGETIITLDDITALMKVKVSFDGKLYETNPAKIVAEKIEIIVENE